VQHLRVGFFTEVYRPVVNGVVASVDALAEGLRARGHEVYCFAPKVPGYDEAVGPVYRMPSLPLPAAGPYRLTIPLLSRRNVQNIVRRLSIVHVHSPFITGWMGMRYARRYGMPLIYTYHTKLEEYAHYVPFEPNATRFAAEVLTRGFADQADVVVVPTPAMAARLRELGVAARIEIVPTGIDLLRLGAGRRDPELRARLGVRDGARMLLFVSRLAREKNVDVLLRALALTPGNVQLIIGGDGPERGALEMLAKELHIGERVTFAGPIDRDALPDLYASCDAFVFPSTTETQGLVQAEALAAGALVIAADATSNREVLGGAGMVVAPTIAGFQKAFEAVPVVPVAAERERARKSAQRFSIDAQAERMLEIYCSLLTRREPSGAA
jgi:1,2-diacylglycerol 3-alpha-glucosyltransferase